MKCKIWNISFDIKHRNGKYPFFQLIWRHKRREHESIKSSMQISVIWKQYLCDKVQQTNKPKIHIEELEKFLPFFFFSENWLIIFGMIRMIKSVWYFNIWIICVFYFPLLQTTLITEWFEVEKFSLKHAHGPYYTIHMHGEMKLVGLWKHNTGDAVDGQIKK